MKGDLFLFSRDAVVDRESRIRQSAIVYAKDEASAWHMLEADLEDIERSQDGDASLWYLATTADWHVEKHSLDREGVVSLWMSR